MSYATIDAVRAHLGKTAKAHAYDAKMMHPLPAGAIVDRTVFILQQVAGKRVLEFGASGALHDGIVKAAASVYATDKVARDGLADARDLDVVRFDTVTEGDAQPEVMVCGEVLEHLGNPGWFLTRLRAQYPGVPLVVSVPNAFSRIAQRFVADGLENVHADHVAWYSPRTLRTLLERAGYTIREFAYYNGDGPTAEGLIAVAV